MAERLAVAARAPSQDRLPGFLAMYRNSMAYLILLLPSLGAAVGTVSSGPGGGELMDASGSAFSQVLVLFVFLNSIMLAMMLRISFGRVAFALLPAALMLAWIFLSIAWSEYPDLTLRRGSREIIEVLSMTLLALTFRDDRALLRILLWSFFIVAVLDLMSFAVPGLSMGPGGFQGVHGNKNTLGAIYFCALPAFVIGIADRGTTALARAAALLGFLGGLMMLVLSQSKSAIGLFAFSSVMVVFIRSTMMSGIYTRVLAPLMALILGVGVAAVVSVVGINRSLTVLLGDATLTGRDQLWRYALAKHDSHPLAGVGYGALWQIGQQIETIFKDWDIRWLANEGHNGYIDILAQLGDVGLACFVVYLAVTFSRLVRANLNRSGASALGLVDYAVYMFLGAILYNITESSWFRPGHPTWTMVMLLTVCVTARRSQAAYIPATPAEWDEPIAEVVPSGGIGR